MSLVREKWWHGESVTAQERFTVTPRARLLGRQFRTNYPLAQRPALPPPSASASPAVLPNSHSATHLGGASRGGGRQPASATHATVQQQPASSRTPSPAKPKSEAPSPSSAMGVPSFDVSLASSVTATSFEMAKQLLQDSKAAARACLNEQFTLLDSHFEHKEALSLGKVCRANVAVFKRCSLPHLNVSHGSGVCDSFISLTECCTQPHLWST